MLVAATGRTIRAAGVSAAGIFRARADSIWRRTAEDEAMGNFLRLMFAYAEVGVSIVVCTELSA